MLQGYGAFVLLLWSIAGGSPTFLVHSTKPFTGESVLVYTKRFYQHLQTQPLDQFDLPNEVVLASVPSIMVDIATAGNGVIKDLVENTRAVVVGGAGLPLKVGDLLTEQGVNIVMGYGT